QRAWLRMDGQHWLAYATEHKATKRTASVLRAAWRRSMATELLDAITASEKAPTKDQQRDARSRMNELALSLQDDAARPAYAPPDGSPRAGAGSKRKSLKHTPHDWRAKLFNACKKADKPLIMALAFGARPEELRKGVKVDFLEDGAIRLTIRGAKITDHSGQPERVVTVNTPTFILGKEVAPEIGSITVTSDSGQAFQKRLTRLAKKLGFEGVTAYSFRHNFAADLKKMGMDTGQIAQALGQQSEKTQRQYGHASQSKAGWALQVEATATITPRPEQTTLVQRLGKRLDKRPRQRLTMD
nr:site-specific integrase [Halothiobacillus sp.]